ncbi:hypothetical protein [Prosthecochloris sp.]|uniref:hypothetical protein n=1 Tax=Prosthecochloris sp. TaxID=290513 RepID=UPI00257D9D61|nr:hypothetical protein [Prosthecochloris sp.]
MASLLSEESYEVVSKELLHDYRSTFPIESHAALDAASILTFIGRWIPAGQARG